MAWMRQARRRAPLTLAGLSLLMACGAEAPPETVSADAATASPNHIVRRLTSGEPALGVFSGDHTPEQGAAMGTNRETDFVFYSLEEPPFDVAALASYMAAMTSTAGKKGRRPVALRIPPVRGAHDQARARIAEALAAGVDAIVVPHVGSRDDAEVTVGAMGEELWPGDPDGRLVAMLIIEDREGVAHARDIVGTPGVSVVFVGPTDLRRAYEGDGEAVENAIQTVLAACKEFMVPCGITAGVDDIAKRLQQGFRVVIVLQPQALSVGLEASRHN